MNNARSHALAKDAGETSGASRAASHARLQQDDLDRELEQLGLGLIVSTAASLINLGVALVLMRAGKRHNSITLEADGRHLMTDVWTTAGVLVGIALVWITGRYRFDPIIALLVAANILFTGYRLLVRSGRGLLDVALPAEELSSVKSILDSYKEQGVNYHALRSRQAAARKFMVVHLLVPGNWSIKKGHTLAEQVEKQVIGDNKHIDFHIDYIFDINMNKSLRVCFVSQETSFV
jgi:cation diffusion facilitator family transporter